MKYRSETSIGVSGFAAGTCAGLVSAMTAECAGADSAGVSVATGVGSGVAVGTGVGAGRGAMVHVRETVGPVPNTLRERTRSVWLPSASTGVVYSAAQSVNVV